LQHGIPTVPHTLGRGKQPVRMTQSAAMA
jgi:hypothetical protein